MRVSELRRVISYYRVVAPRYYGTIQPEGEKLTAIKQCTLFKAHEIIVLGKSDVMLCCISLCDIGPTSQYPGSRLPWDMKTPVCMAAMYGTQCRHPAERSPSFSAESRHYPSLHFHIHFFPSLNMVVAPRC